MERVAQELIKGEPRAIAKAISLVENDGRLAKEMMKEIFAHSGQSVIVGITGAPGSGKSTLVDQMIHHLKKEGHKIGIVAVDPSSPFSGGAILGDRIRMMRHSTDPDVFIRSMATRGHLGGLAKTTGEAITILEAAGKDFILVETLGVGQDEVEIAKTADTTIVVLAPGLGDTIQSMKAGVMEIADLYVINKADRSGADALVTEVRIRVEQDAQIKEATWQAPVLKTVAVEDQGTEPLLEAIENHRSFLKESGRLEKVRREKTRQETLSLLKEEISRNILEKILGDGLFDDLIDDIVAHKKDPYTSVKEIVGTVFPDEE